MIITGKRTDDTDFLIDETTELILVSNAKGITQFLMSKENKPGDSIEAEKNKLERLAESSKMIAGVENTLEGQHRRFRELSVAQMNELTHHVKTLNARLKRIEAQFIEEDNLKT